MLQAYIIALKLNFNILNVILLNYSGNWLRHQLNVFARLGYLYVLSGLFICKFGFFKCPQFLPHGLQCGLQLPLAKKNNV